MNKKVEINYSVCFYIPSAVRNESVIFGMIIHCPSSEYVKFYRTKNIRRIKSFDDEYDKEYMDAMTESFQYYFDNQELDFYGDYDERFHNIQDKEFIDINTRYFVNDFKFTPTRTIISSNKTLEKDISDLQKTYLYYDKPKTERITTKEVKRLLNKELKNLNLINKSNENESLDFAERKIFDFEYEKYAIKTFSFNYKRKNDVIDQAKNFGYDIITNKEILNSKKIKLIIADYEKEEEKEFIQLVLEEFKNIDNKIEFVTFSEYTKSLIAKGIN